jgi:predicted Na+-dependent transporter
MDASDLLNNGGVALILFVQGLGMATERMKASAGNWRLHLIVQGFTFLLFPALGLLFHELTGRLANRTECIAGRLPISLCTTLHCLYISSPN